ncbi:MAG: hypothetical protein ABIV48_05695 [Pyrinomonadaceae bacterium]
MVDEAKAFCPGCGSSFVEEKAREEASGFDKMDSTVQFGQTMYNQMLSDMGLSSAKTPKAPEKRVEVLRPEPVAAVAPKRTEVKQKPSGNLKWFILGGILLVIIFILIIAAAGVLWYFWPRIR